MSIRKKALDYLANREHSELELSRKLSRFFSQNEIESIIDQLRSENLVSDLRYGQMRLKVRMEAGYGPNFIRQELLMKGVPDEIINQIMNVTIDWGDVASRIIAKKNPLSREAAEKHLFRKGFNWDIIKLAVKLIEE